MQALQERGMTRPDALAEMLRLYCQRMHSNEPVHTWDLQPRTLESMTDEVMDWDGAYRQQGAFEGPPPWNIGEPQPELAER